MVSNNTSSTCHHVVYWTIPQIGPDGKVVAEQHYAVNLAEIDPADARRIESLLRGWHSGASDRADPRGYRTDPAITRYRHLFRPFIEVKRNAGDLCRFSTVWLPYVYAEYANPADEPKHHSHPSVRQLAGAG